MTRKHFVALAVIVNNAHLVYRNGYDDTPTIIEVIGEKIADFCETQNPNFDRERFIEACRKDI